MGALGLLSLEKVSGGIRGPEEHGFCVCWALPGPLLTSPRPLPLSQHMPPAGSP